jgi:hypothetical protein
VACVTKKTKRDPSTATNTSRRQMEDTAGNGGGIGRLKNHRARVQPPEAEEDRDTIEAGSEDDWGTIHAPSVAGTIHAPSVAFNKRAVRALENTAVGHGCGHR